MESRDALRAAALLGPRFSIPALLQAGFEAATLDPLFDSGILEEAKGSQARFFDPMLMEDELARIPWSKKRKLSLRIAEALERTRAAPELIGQHHVNAQNFANAEGPAGDRGSTCPQTFVSRDGSLRAEPGGR